MVLWMVVLPSRAAEAWSPPPAASCDLDGDSWWHLAAREVDPDRPDVILLPGSGEELFAWSPLDGAYVPLGWDGPNVSSVTNSDVSGDGRLDLLIRTWDDVAGRRLGALVHPDTPSDVVLLSSSAVGQPFRGLGDVHGDGAGDVAFGQELWVSTGEAPWLTLRGVVGQYADAQSVTALGDVDGDGLDDLAVTAWTPGLNPYFQPYGPLEVLLGDALLPTLGGTIGSNDQAYGFGVVDVNVDADLAREFLLLSGDVVDDYGGVRGELTLVDDLDSGLAVLATLTTTRGNDDSAAGLGRTTLHELSVLRDGSSTESALVAWFSAGRIEELAVNGTEVRTGAVYRPPEQWILTDGLASDLDHDGTIDLVAVGEDGYTADARVVAWLRSDEGGAQPARAIAVSCGEPPPPSVPAPETPLASASADSESCGCTSSRSLVGGSPILAWLVAVRRRRC